MTKDEKIKRGQAISEMKMSKGWKYIKDYLDKRIELLEHSLLAGGFSNIEDYNLKHQEYMTYLSFLKELDRWEDEANSLMRDNNQ